MVSLQEYVALCGALLGWGQEKKDLIFSQTGKAISYYNSPKKLRFEELHALEKQWYHSLSINEPDFSVYDDDLILADLWACWAVYSRGYLKTIASDKSLGDKSIVTDIGPEITSVIDLGCGIGYTTAALKKIFPNAEVYGTNIEDTKQYAVAQENGRIFGFSMKPRVSLARNKGTLVIGFEYFEHFYNPIEHLIELIGSVSPSHLILANSFSSRSVGHFNEYSYRNTLYDNKTISRVFNKELRQMGYIKVKTKCWNDRPAYWKKNES